MNKFTKLLFVFLCSIQFCVEVAAQGASSEIAATRPQTSAGFASDPVDPKNQLEHIQVRAQQTNGLIPFSPLQPLRDRFKEFNDALYQATYLKIGLAFHHVFQGASDVLPGTSDYGATTDFDFTGSWELFRRGQPTKGEIFFGVEGRWDYNTIGPQNIGFGSIGTAGGTANSFSAYDPTFILRNLYYHQGSEKVGWVYRFGKITIDAMLLTNRHITPNTTFLPNAGTGVFGASYADSGLGVGAAWYINVSAKITASADEARLLS